MAVTTYIVDKDGNQIDASTATVPSDRAFRGAWSLSGSVISEDLDTAKDIFRDKVPVGSRVSSGLLRTVPSHVQGTSTRILSNSPAPFG